MKCICISCFDYYSTRIQKISMFFENKGYYTTYLYADFDHFKKDFNTGSYRHGIKIHVPRYKRNLSLARLFSHYIFAKRVMKYVKKKEPDLIYCIFPPNTLVKQVANYKKRNDVKVIFDCYDMWPESFPYDKWKSLLKFPFRIWKNLRKNSISKADMILAVSEQGKGFLQEEVRGKPIRILRPLIEPGNLPDYNSDVSEYISFCYLGMINHITDIELGVSILSAVNKRKPVILHIIGKGQNLNEFVEKLKINGIKVICHGIVFDMSEKNKIFAQCNLGLNIPRKEIRSTMPLKAIEYLRAGLPFLNSAEGDIENIVNNNSTGIDVVGKNISTVAEELLSLTNDSIMQLHNNCVDYYRHHFENEDLEKIFKCII